MRIGGSGTIEANVNPSGAGTVRGNDIVSNENRVFIADFPTIGATVGEFSVCQLFNAIGSGVIVFIDWLWFYSGTSSGVELTATTVAEATDHGVWQTRSNIGSDGITHFFSDTVAAKAGTLLGSLIITGSDGRELSGFGFPFVLREGEGFSIQHRLANKQLRCLMMGREV